MNRLETEEFVIKFNKFYWFALHRSTFSEYTVCLEISLAKIDPSSPLEKASTLLIISIL